MPILSALSYLRLVPSNVQANMHAKTNQVQQMKEEEGGVIIFYNYLRGPKSTNMGPNIP